MGRRPEEIFFQRRHVDDQQAHEEMLNVANHQRTANENQNERSPHICQKDCHQKDHK